MATAFIEAPSDGALPEGWKIRPLGTALPLEYGKALPARARTNSGQTKVYGSSGPVGLHSEQFLDGPVIIVGRKGSAGSVHYSSGPCWPIDTAYYVRLSDSIDPRYAYHLLTALRLDQLDQSTAIPSLSRDKYGAIGAPFPPLEIQRRVAQRIDELFAEIDDGEEELRRARQELQTYRRTLLKAAVTGELSVDWRRERPAQNDVARSGFADWPLLPAGWVYRRLETLLSNEPNSIADGPFGSNLKTSHYRSAGPRVIRLQNIGKHGQFVDEKAHVAPEHFDTLSRHHVKSGDLVVAILGEVAPRAALVPDDIGPALVKADCFKVRLGEEMDRIFVWAWLNSDIVQSRLTSAIKGVGRPRIGMKDIRHLPVPMPSLSEQRAVSERLTNALAERSELEAVIGEIDKQTREQRQSILAAAFRGNLAQ